MFQFHDVVKCLSTKQEIHFTVNWEVNEIWPVYVIVQNKKFNKKFCKTFNLKISPRYFAFTKN